MSEETITLHSSGSLPGIPGDHAPGTYLVDYEARTIRLAQDTTSTTETPAEAEQGAQDEAQTVQAPQEQPVSPPQTQNDGMPEVVTVPDLPQEPVQQSSNQ